MLAEVKRTRVVMKVTLYIGGDYDGRRLDGELCRVECLGCGPVRFGHCAGQSQWVGFTPMHMNKPEISNMSSEIAERGCKIILLRNSNINEFLTEKKIRGKLYRGSFLILHLKKSCGV